MIGYDYISMGSASRFDGIDAHANLLLLMFLGSEATMKLPYGYVLIDEEIVAHEKKRMLSVAFLMIILPEPA